MGQILNNTARKYSLADRLDSGEIRLVKVWPGMNSVPDEVVQKLADLEYVKVLQDKGDLILNFKAVDLPEPEPVKEPEPEPEVLEIKPAGKKPKRKVKKKTDFLK